MTTKTITDFETVEKKREVTHCDHCTNTSEDEVEMVEVAVNPITHSTEQYEVVEVLDDDEGFWKADQKARGWNNYNNRSYGVGKSEQIKRAESSAKIDLCDSCLSDLFDIDISPHEIVKDIDIKQGEINIETEEVIERKYPEFSYGGTKLGILCWPLGLLLAFINTSEEHWGSPREEYLEAAHGAILWFTILFTFAYLTGLITIV